MVNMTHTLGPGKSYYVYVYERDQSSVKLAFMDQEHCRDDTH